MTLPWRQLRHLLWSALLLSLIPRIADAQLPQDHQYQRELVKWIATLTEADVTIPTGVAPQWDRTYPSRTWLAETYVELGRDAVQNAHMPLYPGGSTWEVSVFEGLPRHFTLAGLQDVSGLPDTPSPTPSKRVRHARRVYPGAYWYNKSLPFNGGEGNPYKGDRALANRVLVTTAVGLIMVDWWHSQPMGKNVNPWDISAYLNPDSRFLGGLMNGWAYAYVQTRDVLPSYAKVAFEDGFKRMTAKLLAQRAGRNTPNMTTRVIPAMAMLSRHAQDPELRAMALRCARLYVTGYEDGSLWDNWHPNSLAYPAGYVQEGLSPETTYNGVSLYHLTEAYARSGGDPEWDWLKEPIRRMSEFRAHQLFQFRPGGGLLGPSAYAGRTGGGWDALQASHPWRDMTIAVILDEGLPFNVLNESSFGLMTVDRMISKLGPVFRDTGRWNTQHWPKLSTNPLPEFRLEHDLVWPGYVAYHAPAKDWYDTVFPLVQSEDQKTVVPFLRDGYYFSTSFAGDFWSHKATDGSQDFGFFVETEADGGTYGGLRGGSLQAFWTERGGLFILGRKNKNARLWDQVELWPGHHIWGHRPDGKPFSSAVERYQEVEYAGAGLSSSQTVTVEGGFSDPDYQPNPIALSRRTAFTALPNGIRIEHHVEGNPSDLWVTLPIPVSNATISRRSGDQWVELGTNLVETQEIRLGRTHSGGTEYVYVRFDKAANVRLSSKTWTQSYQGNTSIRNVHIALKSSSGSSPFTLSYSITTSESQGGPPPSSAGQGVNLPKGWNLVSSYVNPANPKMESVFSDVQSQIGIVKDQNGRTYVPELELNDIGDWRPTSAYMVYAKSSVNLSIQGTAVDASNTSIELPLGWTFLPYPRSSAMPIEDALAPILSDVILVRDSAGRTFVPGYGVNDIGTLQPGAGYKLYMKKARTLTYP